AGAVVPVLAPAEVALRAPRALRRRTEPALPVDGPFARLRVDVVVPLAVRVVATVAALRPQQLAQLVRADQLACLLPLGLAAALCSELHDAAARLRCVADPEGVLETPREGLLDVDVAAARERGERDFGVDVVGRRHDDRVQVLALEQAAVV